ncbi:protein arginine N-methyltransferase 7 [Coccinella septempunctata]|uniref:protein arginine N-methyltransferase 7 n=1 Tax=Coccinella septempunctata TaxID=41139 RepID=UPI001D0736D7|nr:protein arginine N-methyltransferase 7 [Coccinella septempunctata]
MELLVAKKNILTGSIELVSEHEDFDCLQEIARSSFADMLHDTERNQMYEAALKVAIEKKHRDGQKAVVLDIGTGTGLLSMMAVRNGADKVSACEAFKPISDCAVDLIELNGFKDKIKVIPKKSVDLTVGEDGDLDEKCNILVTEVFDTELIGEGALSTFNHAHEFLLTKDCIVIPNSATIYAQIVECPFAHKWNRMADVYDEDGQLLLEVPNSIKYCSGSAAVHDFQLSQLSINSFKTLMKPTPIFEFNWSSYIPLKRTIIKTAKAECDGKAQAVFIWWDLKMDFENKIILSCAPYWDHPLSRNDKSVKIPWRDHWMQAAYYFPKERKFVEGEELNLLAVHDEYSLWFNIKKNSKFEEEEYDVPSCSCSFHTFPRSRIAQINDGHRKKVLIDVMRHEVKDKNILVISNGFYLSLIASKFNANKIYILDDNCYSYRIMLDFILENNLNNVLLFKDLKHLLIMVPHGSIDVVLSEPYFTSSILPWDNVHLHFVLKKVKSILKEDVKIFPKAACVKAIAVQFDDLHKIRAPLKECEGFKMVNFDKLIQESSNICDEMVEAQPLWEYPATALSSVKELFRMDFSRDNSIVQHSSGYLQIESKQECNGVVVWVEWLHGETNDHNVISTGAIATPEIGKKIKWDVNCRQAVCLFENKLVESLRYQFKIDLIHGRVNFIC